VEPEGRLHPVEPEGRLHPVEPEGRLHPAHKKTPVSMRPAFRVVLSSTLGSGKSPIQ
jgi:hypothetical protein